MALKQFTVQYPDGSKKNVSANKRDQMYRRGELSPLGAKRYLFMGIFAAKTLRCKGFEGLKALLPPMTAEQMKRYLERLEVIFAQASEREWQAEETPVGFQARLQEMGMPETGFSEP